MKCEMNTHEVYVKTDADGRITAINSSAFLPDAEGWMLIDQGHGDRYAHAQGNYLPQPIMDEFGVYQYKLVNGVVTERTVEEMMADYIPPEENAGNSELEAKVEALQKQVDEQASLLAAYEAAYKEGVQSA